MHTTIHAKNDTVTVTNRHIEGTHMSQNDLAETGLDVAVLTLVKADITREKMEAEIRDYTTLQLALIADLAHSQRHHVIINNGTWLMTGTTIDGWRLLEKVGNDGKPQIGPGNYMLLPGIPVDASMDALRGQLPYLAYRTPALPIGTRTRRKVYAHALGLLTTLIPETC